MTTAASADALLSQVGGPSRRFRQAGTGRNQDVAPVRELHHVGSPLLACVAGGLPEFAERLGPASEGVLGPVQ